MGLDGALHDYEIKFTFGVTPLQQYLIEMPRGRLQALGIAWDSRARENGGQHWFRSSGSEAERRRPTLDRIGRGTSCAPIAIRPTCARTIISPRARMPPHMPSIIDFACEACPGPGSIVWCGRRGDRRRYQKNHGLLVALDERHGVSWTTDRATGDVVRSTPRRSEREIQTCARCHSRRSQIHEDYVHGQPVGDDYRISLLDDNLYYPDGQIKDEVYEYGSFIQSRMFHAGVTCSDCLAIA